MRSLYTGYTEYIDAYITQVFMVSQFNKYRVVGTHMPINNT